MLKAEVLDELFGARDSVTDQVIALTPRDESEKAKLMELMKQRDRLTAKINEVIAAPFTKEGDLASPEVEAAVKNLENATGQLKALKKTMEGVQAVIDGVNQVIKIATGIAALLA